MIKIKSDKIIVDNKLFDGYVYVENGIIKDVSTKDLSANEFYDYTGSYVSPGFIDIHTHGGGGYPFASSDAESVLNACDFHLKYGTTSILPTISTGEINEIVKSLENIKKAMVDGKAKGNILGAHLEGPYLSKNQIGAQSKENAKIPSESEYEDIIQKFEKVILRWTYAPEIDVDQKFVKTLNKNGIIASAGHSDAKFEDMKKAVENGCNLVTHLYSCTSTVTRDRGFRSLGVIESAYLLDELFVEIIADGKHLPIELIKMIIKIKGEDKVLLVTDSLEIAGSTAKEGVMSGVEFKVENGVCMLKDGTGFAGSIATSNLLIKALVEGCNYSIPFAVKMLTETPAKLLNLNKGKIKPNYDADIIVFDDKINVSTVFVGGKKVI